MKYAIEKTDIVIDEIHTVQKPIDVITPHETVPHRINVLVKYILSLTMIDGKVCHAVTETTSAQRCF